MPIVCWKPRSVTTYPQSDVSSNTFIKSILPEYPKGSSQSALQVRTFLVWVVECRGTGKFELLHISHLVIQSRLKRGRGIQFRLSAILGLSCRWWCHFDQLQYFDKQCKEKQRRGSSNEKVKSRGMGISNPNTLVASPHHFNISQSICLGRLPAPYIAALKSALRLYLV